MQSHAVDAPIVRHRPPQDILSELWAMLSRPAVPGASSTLAERLAHSAGELAAELAEHGAAQAALAGTLADFLATSSHWTEGMSLSPRLACVDAIEQLILALSMPPDLPTEGTDGRHAPLVLLLVPESVKRRRLQIAIRRAQMDVIPVDTAARAPQAPMNVGELILRARTLLL